MSTATKANERSKGDEYFEPGPIGRRRRYDVLCAELRNDRASFESHWRELAENFAPRRVRFSTTDTNKGDKRNQKIIDTTPVYALRTMKAGMMSGITSPARPWFELRTGDAELDQVGNVKAYLDEVRDAMLAAIAKSNTYTAFPTLYGDMGCFGTGAMAVTEDPHTVFRCTPFAIGEYYLAIDDNGRVRTFMREFRFTVRQLVERFAKRDARGRVTDWSNFSQHVRDAYDRGTLGILVDVIHIVQPNAEHDPSRLSSTAKRYAECYFERSGETSEKGIFLREAGYDEFPVLAGRWDVTPGDVYATDCPGMTALGDAKQLQFNEKSGAQILDKINKPPMVAPESMRGKKLSQLPGDVTYVPDEQKDNQFRSAYDVSHFRFDLLEGKQQQVRSRVDRAFFADLFLLLSQTDRPDMTATEIIERKEEKLLALGPMLENLNQDVLDPFIDRVFGIMHRAGLLPGAPQELEGRALHVEYVSVMAQAQKAVGRSGLQGFAGFVGQLAAVEPSVLDKIDADQLVDEAADLFNVPAKIIVPDDQVQQKRAARAQQQQAAQAAQTAQTAAGAAQTLSQTDTSGKNALTDIMGQLGGALGDSRGQSPGALPAGVA